MSAASATCSHPRAPTVRRATPDDRCAHRETRARARWLVLPPTLASPIADRSGGKRDIFSLFGVVRRGVEAHVRAGRTSRRARRPAIDSASIRRRIRTVRRSARRAFPQRARLPFRADGNRSLSNQVPWSPCFALCRGRPQARKSVGLAAIRKMLSNRSSHVLHFADQGRQRLSSRPRTAACSSVCRKTTFVLDTGKAGRHAAFEHDHALGTIGIEDRHAVDRRGLVSACCRIHDVVGADHQGQRSARSNSLLISSMSYNLSYGNVRFGEQDVHVSGHSGPPPDARRTSPRRHVSRPTPTALERRAAPGPPPCRNPESRSRAARMRAESLRVLDADGTHCHARRRFASHHCRLASERAEQDVFVNASDSWPCSSEMDSMNPDAPSSAPLMIRITLPSTKPIAHDANPE